MISFPWDSIVERMEDGYPVYDRAYSAQQWWDIYKTFFTNGVFGNYEKGLQVIPGGGMTVKVQPGACNVNGCFGHESVEKSFTILPAASQPRIDCIVLRWDSNVEARSIDIFYKEGTPAASPKAPTLTRDETIWELGLANITVAANATSISASAITDTRADKARCGIVSPLMEVNTTGWYEQVQQFLKEKEAELNEQKNQGQAHLNTMYDELQKATDAALQATKDALDGSLAGSIQNQIDNLNDMTTGTNLIRGSRDFTIGASNVDGYKNRTYDGFANGGPFDLYKDEDGFTVAHKEQSGLSAVSLKYIDTCVVGIPANSKLTFSMDVKVDDYNSFDDRNILTIHVISKSTNSIVTTIRSMTDFITFTGGLSSSGVWLSGKVSFNIGSHSPNDTFLLIRMQLSKNGSIHFKKPCLQIGDINNPIWSPNPFDENDLTTELNLLRGTRDFVLGTEQTFSNATGIRNDGFRVASGDNVLKVNFEKDEEGFTVAEMVKVGTTSYGQFNSSAIKAFSPNETLTLCFEFMSDDFSQITNGYIINIGAWKGTDKVVNLVDKRLYDIVPNPESNKWYKIVIPFNTVNADPSEQVLVAKLQIPMDASVPVGASIKYRKVCVYRGNINNPVWSASPFDVASSYDWSNGKPYLLGLVPDENIIQNSADLNTYNVAGTYACQTSTIVNTLKNCPVSEAFCLVVEYTNRINTNTVRQTLRGYYTVSPEWERFSSNSGSSWSEWRQTYSKTTVRPIEGGGTNANNAASARTNLGITRDWLVSTIGTFSGATTTKAGTVGLVPAPTGL